MKNFKQFINESLITEAKGKSKAPKDSERTAIVLDGTSSAGKSYTAGNSGIKTKTRWKKDDKGEYVKDKDGNFVRNEVADDEYQTIALDDYWGSDDLSNPDLPENQARWDLERNDPFYTKEELAFSKKWGDTFAHIGKDYKEKIKEWKADAENQLKTGKDGEGKAIDVEKKKKEIKRYEDQLAEWPDPARNHPEWDKAKENAKKKGQEFREWEPHRFYMQQEYKQSKSKNIMFDDISGDVSHFLPDGATKTVLLHAPMDKLVENIERREEKDGRDPRHVFDDYASKYQFTKEKPSDGNGQPGKPIKKAQIMAMLKKCQDKGKFKKSTIDDEWVESFAKDMGLDDDNATYYMKVKDEYVKQNEPIIVNAGEDNQKTFDTFKDVVKAEEERVKSGQKKVGDDLKKEGEKEIKTLEDAGAKKMFQGLDPKMVEDIKKQKVEIAMPGGKKKSIQRETLLDFVPIDNTDPEEQAMIKAQAAEYARISALREKEGLKKLIPFDEWLKRNLELAKDNKDYQARVKAKTLSKMKKAKSAVKENVESFSSFLIESKNDKAFWDLVEKHKLVL
jgi:hypothetical protein